jgi:hypothetical protein
MGILPDYLSNSESFLGEPTSWLADAQRFPLPASPWSAAAGAGFAPPPPVPPPAQPPSGLSPPVPANPFAGVGDLLGTIRAGIPQALADNGNTLLAFGGGALRGGIGQGASDAARIGLHEFEMVQRRKTHNAQQAATLQALRGAGLSNPEAVAAMHPALARVLLAYLHPRP